MSSDGRGGGSVRRPRVIGRPRMPPGPLAELKDLLYELYLQAGTPTLDQIASWIAEDKHEDLAGAAIGFGVALLANRDVLAGVAGVGTGLALIGLGVALLANRDVLAGVAGVGTGVALIGLGAALIGPAVIVSSVHRVIDSATKAPQTHDDQESSQQTLHARKGGESA